MNKKVVKNTLDIIRQIAINMRLEYELENGSYHPNEVSVNEAKQNLR